MYLIIDHIYVIQDTEEKEMKNKKTQSQMIESCMFILKKKKKKRIMHVYNLYYKQSASLFCVLFIEILFSFV